MKNKTLYKIGFWSATFVAIEVLIFALMLILNFWFNTNIISFIACFLLAPTFVAMIASVHCYAPQDKKRYGVK
jgi:archaellum biogenesis protein FlaJ (TadC family)